MEGAYLVAGRVAQVSQVKLAASAFPYAWGIFTGRATIGEARLVPGIRGRVIACIEDQEVCMVKY